MHSYEIGIPIRSRFDHARDTILRAATVEGVTSIHVSVNEANQGEEYLSLLLLDPRVRVSVQGENLGLYGNLRFLAENCETEFFSWLCFDDIPSADLLPCALRGIDPQFPQPSLFVPSMGQRLFDEEQGGWIGPLEDWLVDPVFHSNSPKRIFFGFRTHYVYGLWRTDFLKRIFPSKNFDWLDAYLLAKTISSNGLRHVDAAKFIVGIVDKFPTRVGRKHRLLPWLTHAFHLALSTSQPLKRAFWFSMAVVNISRINQFWNSAESSLSNQRKSKV